jgi:flagellar P-ring protein precursor FlgI
MTGVMRVFAAFIALALAATDGAAFAQPSSIRVKDLGKLQSWRDNTLVGYGVVTGLAGTGDSPTNRTTRQALSNVLARFNLTVPPEQVQSRNVAVVMVSAALPAFAREGDTLDITVSSAGDARSLVGGSLLLTPLQGPDGRVHALAQGALSVGGYRYDANGNVVQKNHPTVGSVPSGAVVEIPAGADTIAREGKLTFVLSEPDFTTASRVAAAINSQVAAGAAKARDASGIDIAVPPGQADQVVAFVARIENVAVQPDRRAKVVINERTGTVVAGGDVTISRVAISHGDLKLSVATQNSVSQPAFVAGSLPGVRTATVSNSQMDVQEDGGGPGYVASGTTVADLVQSLARMKTSTRDVISILRAIKAAGALHAELVVQ